MAALDNRTHNAPRKHHYLPIFYLKRCAGSDGRLCEFSRPFKEIVPRRTHPAGTGYAIDLYSMQGFPPEMAQQIEEKFFGVTDSLAADALKRLETNGPGGPWKSEMRSAWSRFLISLMLRMPPDMMALRTRWKNVIMATDPEEEAEYAKIAKVGDHPATFSEYMAQVPLETIEKYLFEVFVPLMDNERIGEAINRMVWSVVRTDAATHELLTSDRPIVRTGLRHEFAHIILRMGPRILFIAANNTNTVQQFKKLSASALVRNTNRLIVEQANSLVIGRDDKQIQFVRNRFGADAVQPLIKLTT